MDVVSIIIALIVFSVLILIHEFGHFLLAKKNGICVVEFSLGMGPRIASFKKGETRYSWKAIPFGGSCMMLGEGFDVPEEEGEEVDPERSFDKKGVWARISVVVAGPIFNFLLSIVLAMIVIGFVGIDRPVVEKMDQDSPAYQAGLREGDIVTKYNGSGVSVAREIWLQDYVNPVSSGNVDITVKRDGQTKTFSVPVQQKEKYQIGVSYTGTSDGEAKVDMVDGGVMKEAGFENGDVITKINDTKIEKWSDLTDALTSLPSGGTTIEVTAKRGSESITRKVTPQIVKYTYTGFNYNLDRQKVGSVSTIGYSFCEIKYQIKTVFKSLGMLFTGKLTKDDVAGPVGVVNIISDTVNETSSEGAWMTMLNVFNLIILLSANLGVMNLLPFPALDGGRLVFLLIEVIRGKPVPKEKEGMVHMAGMVILMILMVFIMFNDISRLFR